MDVEHHVEPTSDNPEMALTEIAGVADSGASPDGCVAGGAPRCGRRILRRDAPARDLVGRRPDPGGDEPLRQRVARAVHERGVLRVRRGRASRWRFRLRTAVRWHGLTRIVPGMLALAGLSLIASGVFEVDRPLAPTSMEETIHSNAAVGAFVLMIMSMLLFAVATRTIRAGGRSGGWPRRWPDWLRRPPSARSSPATGSGPERFSACSPERSWRGSC